MLIPKLKVEEFEKFGFKKCKANMVRAVVIIFAFQGGAKCYSLVQKYLT